MSLQSRKDRLEQGCGWKALTNFRKARDYRAKSPQRTAEIDRPIPTYEMSFCSSLRPLFLFDGAEMKRQRMMGVSETLLNLQYATHIMSQSLLHDWKKQD